MIYQNTVAAPRAELADYVQEGLGDDTEFKGLMLAPESPSSQLTAWFPKITIATGDLMRAANRRRAPGTNFNRWQMAVESGTLTLPSIGEEQSIADETQATYEDYFDLEAIGTTEAMTRMKRGHELAVSEVMMNSSSFDAVNSSVAYSITNIATIDFVGDVFAAIRRLKARGESPNTIVIPGLLYDVIRFSAALKLFIVGVNGPGSVINDETILAVFKSKGITSVVVPDSYVNQSDSLVSDVINPIWGNNYVWVGRVATGPLRNGGWGRTVFWDKMGPLFPVSTYRDETKKSNIVRAETFSAPVVVNARAGTLIGSQV